MYPLISVGSGVLVGVWNKFCGESIPTLDGVHEVWSYFASCANVTLLFSAGRDIAMVLTKGVF